MLKNCGFYIVLVLFAFSCTEKKGKHNKAQHVKFTAAKGKTIPAGKPQIISVNERKLKKISAGKPTLVPTNNNIHLAGVPKIIVAGKPRICTIGQDPFKLPKPIPANDSFVTAGIPEVVIAKDPANKDQNPQNFSFFGKLQGLKHGSIRCMLQDKIGNLWFGTDGGGVSRYDGKSFSNYTDKEGLANNAVWSMLEDKAGNLWFGTYGGCISCYDGKSFRNYVGKVGFPNSTVASMLEDKSGNLWFGTYGGGVSKYDGKSFSNYTEKEGLANNAVWSILEDKSGNLWFGTDYGVSKYDGKSFSNYTDQEGLAHHGVASILEDKSGNIWFGTYGGGVSKYDGTSFSNYTDKEGLANNTVYSILEDNSGNLWFGTYGGISKYDGKSFSNYTNKEGLVNNGVWCILEDKSGNLWFGTDGGGVSRYYGKSFSNYTDKEGLANNAVWSILEDKSGNIWFGTYGGGVSCYDGKSFSNYTDKEGLANNAVASILEDKSGNLWFGTNGGVSKYDGKSFSNYTDQEGLAHNAVASILEDKSGNIWFGTYGGGVSKYDGKSFINYTDKEGLANNTLLSILQDKSGNIWFGTYGGGVSKYDGKSFINYTDNEGLAHNTVYSIVEDHTGNLWFGTFGGVSRYDGKSFSSYTDKEGLANSTVVSILEDHSGNLWFGTRFGLSKLPLSKLSEINDKVTTNSVKEEDVFFKNYTFEDGFSGIGCYRNSICEASDGTIWVGTIDRLTAYHPCSDTLSDLVHSRRQIHAPNIQLTSVALFNENVEWVNFNSKVISNKLNDDNTALDTAFTLGNGVIISDFEFDGLTKWYNLPQHLSLAYNNNYLTFNFIGVTMMQPKKVKYQYKLVGIDENWSALTTRTEAPYGNLPSGNYTFKVKAMDSEGHWSNEFNYSFVIRPPWWQTWWFRTSVILSIFLLAVASVWYYIKSRERKLIAEKEKLERTVEERTAEVVKEKKIVEMQKNLLEEHQKEIIDSINYAERIQRSFIATKEVLDENLNDYFVLFKPKDIVSGDFYWAGKLNNGNFALVTADSTGHGVPGAIMSLLNVTSLEKAIETHVQPCEILNATRDIIVERLKKDGSAEGGSDGMDASLTVYDFRNKKLIIAAANNPVWIVRGTETIEIKPDKMPVGKHEKEPVSFTQQEIDLQKGDVVYSLTDGFADQFGGKNGKKFMQKKLRQLLSSNAHLPMHEQKRLLEDAFINWLGNLEQVDDVTLIGVRV